MLDKLLKEHRISSFTEGEICKRNVIPSDFTENIIPTLIILQRIRDGLNLPINIHSTYRSKEYNLTIGGAKNSLHLVFNAVDFSVKSFRSSDYYLLSNFLRTDNFSINIIWKSKSVDLNKNILGIGCYRNFMHIDTRGLLYRKSPSFWIK